VDEWIEDYKRDSSNGLVKLLQFFITASGCKSVLTRMMIEHVRACYVNVIYV
jgi:cohesin complex subunit SA-1/2